MVREAHRTKLGRGAVSHVAKLCRKPGSPRDAAKILVSNAAVTARCATENKEPPRRARRFSTEILIRYREMGSREWKEGTSVNISTSGVLFRPAVRLRPTAELEIKFMLPVAIRGDTPAEIRCKGIAVREVSNPRQLGTPLIAVAIAHHRFVRQEPSSSALRL